MCRAANVEVIHVRALYSDSNKKGLPGGDWGSWLQQFRALNPGKPTDITPSGEAFAQEQDGEKVFLKPEWDAFNGTELHEYLQSKKIKRLLVGGLITSVCVQHTAHGAFARGYQVQLVEDCCGDRSVERHHQAIALYGNYMYGLTDSASLAAEFTRKMRSRRRRRKRKRRNSSSKTGKPRSVQA
jgi:nicotinamidase-related amidase